jgi:AAA domain
MAFQKATKQVAFAKVSFQGKEKSGKTTTAAQTAIYLAKKYHPGKPVAFLASEPGIDFVLDMFQSEGVELLADRSRAFVALKNSIPEAIKAGAGVLLIDSATAYWQEIVKAYRVANHIKGKLQPFHYTPIKEQWREFTDPFVTAQIDILVCGRLGFEFEELEDKDGEREVSRTGTKMKTEGDFNYETDLIVEMTSRSDEFAGNATKAKIGKRTKLVRSFSSHKVHVASIQGSRIWALNGKSFQFQAKDAYAVGDSMKTGACFAPYFDFLKQGGGSGTVMDNQSSVTLFDSANSRDFQQIRQRKEIALEEIKNSLSCVWSAATGKDATVKLEVINALFGTHSWTAVETMHVDVLEKGAQVCRRMKNLALSSMPADREALLSLVKQATDEIDDEIANPPLVEGDLLGAMSAGRSESVPF